MSQDRFFRRFIQQNLFKIDQVKLVYFLSLVVGLLSALAAAILKYSIHYIHKILTDGITTRSLSYLYLMYPLIGMLLTLLFVRYVVKDNIGHVISRILFAISRKKSYRYSTTDAKLDLSPNQESIQNTAICSLNFQKNRSFKIIYYEKRYFDF